MSLVDAAAVSGRTFSGEVLERLRDEVRVRPELSRSALSRLVCEWLDWKGPEAKPKEVSCRVALLKLERRGVIELPAAQRLIPDAKPLGDPGPVGAPISCSLEELGPLSATMVSSSNRALNAEWRQLMAHHYLGPGPLVGAQLRYLIGSDRGWVGALAFSAAAWQVAARDQWIGWSPEARMANLRYVVSNTRFLIPPWVQVLHLGSKILALCAHRLPEDWARVYGYLPVLLETYVEQGRFRGTCYRAANWCHVGETSGRGRQDRAGRPSKPIKDVYVLPLTRQWKLHLCQEPQRGPRAPRLKSEARDWAEEEFGGAELGDERLSKRLLEIARDFYARAQANVPQACGTRARTKATYRLLANRKVTMNEILKPHYEATARRISEHAVVLAVQDTTSFNYTSHQALEGIGPIGNRAEAPLGILMHDTMAYTVNGLPLGLVDAQVWARDPSEFGRSRRWDRNLPIEQKESVKWLRSFKAAAAVQAQCPGTTVVSVGDREADLYELFVLARSRQDHPQLLVRAEYGRPLADEQGHLWEYLAQQPEKARVDIHVRRRGRRKARTASLAVRFAAVELKAPAHLKRLGKSVHLWAVLATEVEAPEDVEPLRWMLLTTMEVATPEQAIEKLQWYTQRWSIEIFHKTLKSGCRIEERQVKAVPLLENCLGVDLVVAWRIVHLTMLGRETPELPCTIFFEDHEWKALYAFIGRSRHAVPEQPPTIRDAMRTVASLGGFLGRKSDGNPGVKSLWLGLERLDDISWAWLSFGPDSELAKRNPPRATSPVSRNPRYG